MIQRPSAAAPGRPAAIEPARRLRGSPALPGDKSISHRALLLALLAEGTSRITGAGDGEDVRTSARLAAELGAEVERLRERAGRVDYRVTSPGARSLREPTDVLDGGNSGTTTRLLLGILAGQPLHAVLTGDASLRSRPMARVTEPLQAMGAAIDGRAGASRLPLAVRGRRPLRAIDWATSVPSAQVKSAILLAALAAEGTTTVHEALATRDHTERMLRARGVAVGESTAADGGHVSSVAGPVAVRPLDQDVPADPSAAAFWLVAGAIHPDAELRLAGVSTNPTRRAIVDLLRRMGARIDEQPLPVAGGAAGEPVADLVVRSSELRGIDLGPEDVAAAIDEIPVLCLAAAVASGTTRIVGAGELRHKESDRLEGVAAGLTALGAQVRVEGDNLTITGGARLRGGPTDARDDHRLAMTFAVAALVANGTTTIDRHESAAISDPGFFAQLEGVRA
ncbi:MAG TPA: 3-phosphoshikimate 1-carboxyvinyltransferase [Candidatus Limnocylindrales bacterium]|nr:3-phosphoshikimate 1-carboxyvinyltransferase [Candidatus Limnocylindrales bacterium]